MKKIFVTGTDTDVGKTYVSALIIQKLIDLGYAVAGFKPISAGCEETPHGLRNEDALILNKASSYAEHNLPYSQLNPIAYHPPIAPHIAAQQVNDSINTDTLNTVVEQWHNMAPDILLTEGAGGWLLPINNQGDTLDSWVQAQQMDIVLVVGMKLGCLNHALMTVKLIEQSGLKLVGWVANCVDPNMAFNQNNIEYLQNNISAPCWGVIPHENDTKLALNQLNIYF